jgi:hypothetical protein
MSPYPLKRILPVLALASLTASAQDFPLVDTGQSHCYDDYGTEISCPAAGQAFCGQDAQYEGTQPQYQDNGDGTVSDLVTGLMWQKTPGGLVKVSWADAVANASSVTTGGYTDWRVPTIKELYSLMNFEGVTGLDEASSTPYLDTATFDFEYGDASAGERMIDAQYWSATEYLDTTMQGNDTTFGVNFADGRIKGYGQTMENFVRYVRGNAFYGTNDFVDNYDGTVTDLATGLMWCQDDSGSGMDWEDALAWIEARNAELYLGYDDWRLPDAKELQGLVDYTRAPGVTYSPAIDPLFDVTSLGDGEYHYYWTSTTHLDGPPDMQGSYAVYVAFGRALGWMEMPPGSGHYELLDVQGAGAQRSDPKTGNPNDYPYGHGPQGDVIRIFNYVRCVRDAEALTDAGIFSDGFESGGLSAWSTSSP